MVRNDDLGRMWKKAIVVNFKLLPTFVQRYWGKVKLSLCLTMYRTMKTCPLLNQEPCHEDVQVSKGTAAHILKLGTRWTWVVNFTVWLLYPQGKSP